MIRNRATPYTVSRWGRVGSGLSMAAIVGFLLTSLWAKYSPVSAQEAPAKAKQRVKVTPSTEKARLPAARPPAAKIDAVALAQVIDREVQKRLQSDNVKASPKSDDAEFLRRVYLDLIGVIPPADKVKEFLDSKDANKRQKVIDELLANPRFGKHYSEIWSGLMLPRESNNRRLNHEPLQQWLAEHFNGNKPFDKLVYDLLTATGPQNENGAVTYFIGNPSVDKITDSVSKLFLGVQLQCAQCHNHPFVDWKQDEYWGMAQFFMKVRLTANPQQAAKKGLSPGIFENNAKAKKGMLPESAKTVPAKFLQGDRPPLDPKEPYRPVLAKWVTSSGNPYFARAMVNRFWHHFFGRGIVNPVDDMHEENGPSHPELLDALTDQFKANDYDLKYLLRAICNSATYQRTSRPVAGNETDKELYSRATVRVLSPEQLYDSLTAVVGTARDVAPKKKGAGAAPKKGPAGTREQFLAFFRIEEGANPLEYQAGIPQALRLMNSAITNSPAAVNQAMEAGKSPAEVIERLYLVALSRRPTAAELQRMTQFVQQAPDPRTGYGDILWVLLNSSEFALNH
jgi:hypothetical protein